MIFKDEAQDRAVWRSRLEEATGLSENKLRDDGDDDDDDDSYATVQ
jgi:hypothetical protein